MFIRSQNLFLRPVWADDWPAILAGASDEAVSRNLFAVPWPYGETQARKFAAEPQDQRYPHFLITRPQGVEEGKIGEAEAVGCIALTRDAGIAGRTAPALGFWIARPHWGQGYATEAAAALLSLAPVLGHHEVVASVFRDNTASSRVLRKLGFQPTGEMALRASPARGEAAPAATFALNLKRHDHCRRPAPACDKARPMVTLRAA